MTFRDFESLAQDHSQPLDFSLRPELEVLALSKRGKWEEAHEIAQDLPDPNGAWLHAFLHREEGAIGNASYWYSRANQPVPGEDIGLEKEWETIAQHFCEAP